MTSRDTLSPTARGSAGPKPRICLVAHYAYRALANLVEGHIGGVEKQISLTAHWLAERGYPVSVVVWNEGQPGEGLVGSVRVISMCRRDAGLPVLRFFHPRWTSLNAALRRADADVYYQNCAEYVTGQVALWCRRHGRRFVYSVASDPDCDPQLPKMKTYRERILYRYGLHHADRIIVQTRRQKQMMEEFFRRDADVLPMPCPGPGEDAPTPVDLAERAADRVLWVARIAPVKRLEWLLDLAERAADLGFEVVGPGDGSDYSANLLERARTMSNVIIQGPLSQEALAERYRQAGVLCCTSSYEGFPNTFLEAWSHGLPVVSTVDPDGLIVERRLGSVGHALSALLAEIRGLLQDPAGWRQCARRGREYYLENHTVNSALPRFERIFLEVCEQGPALKGATGVVL
jgi:glycosyltransferase involved in cell wall biosynthesis